MKRRGTPSTAETCVFPPPCPWKRQKVEIADAIKGVVRVGDPHDDIALRMLETLVEARRLARMGANGIAMPSPWTLLDPAPPVINLDPDQVDAVLAAPNDAPDPGPPPPMPDVEEEHEPEPYNGRSVFF
jgi:hypothetical protein